MCGVLAAFAHDLRHPGLNQNFLLKTRHHLCSLYDVRALACQLVLRVREY